MQSKICCLQRKNPNKEAIYARCFQYFIAHFPIKKIAKEIKCADNRFEFFAMECLQSVYFREMEAYRAPAKIQSF